MALLLWTHGVCAAPGGKEADWEAANLEIRTALDRNDSMAALQAAEKAAAIAREAFGPAHMKTAVALRKLADLQRLNGRPAAAAETLGGAGKSWSDSLGGAHPYVSDLGTQTARDLAAAGDPESAVGAMERVLLSQKKYFGEQHTTVAVSLRELARLERMAGRDRAALDHEREAVQILAAALDPAHTRVLEASVQLASRLSGLGDLDAARQELKNTLDRAAASAHPPLQKLAEVWILSGDLAFADRDIIIAEESYAAAWDLFERAGTAVPASARLALLYKQRELYQAAGREDAAVRAAEAARQIEETLTDIPLAQEPA